MGLHSNLDEQLGYTHHKIQLHCCFQLLRLSKRYGLLKTDGFPNVVTVPSQTAQVISSEIRVSSCKLDLGMSRIYNSISNKEWAYEAAYQIKPALFHLIHDKLKQLV